MNGLHTQSVPTLLIALTMVVCGFCANAANIETAVEQKSESSVSTGSHLNIAVLYSTRGHRGIYKELTERFNQVHPDISLSFHGLLDEQYKESVNQWLVTGEMDVLYWQAGERLNSVVSRELIHPIDNLWREEALDEAFPEAIKNAVSFKQKAYALPFTYYAWGMLYSKPILAQLGLAPPQNWADLLNLCVKARQENIVPIMIGSADPWLPAAWFDYINLRLNGLAFHKQLLRGLHPFTDERVVNVFNHWKQLIDSECFVSEHEHIDWRRLLPPIFRQMAASSLVANFLDVDTPPDYFDRIAFRSFPRIDPEMPVYEDMPLDVFVIANRSKNITSAEKFLAFMSRLDTQTFIAKAIGQSSPHLAWDNVGSLSQQNKIILQNVSGVAQYFDRDIQQSMVEGSLEILAQFLTTPDVERTVKQLEKLRLTQLGD